MRDLIENTAADWFSRNDPYLWTENQLYSQIIRDEALPEKYGRWNGRLVKLWKRGDIPDAGTEVCDTVTNRLIHPLMGLPPLPVSDTPRTDAMPRRMRRAVPEELVQKMERELNSVNAELAQLKANALTT